MRTNILTTAAFLTIALPAFASAPAAPDAPTPPDVPAVSQPSVPAPAPTPMPQMMHQGMAPMQPPAPSAGTGMMSNCMGMMGGGSAGRSGMMHPQSPLAGDISQYTEGKIAFLRAELKPTAEQEPVFSAFVEALKAYGDNMSTHRQTMHDQRQEMAKDEQLTLPTKLGLRVGSMEQNVQALKGLQLALANLYAKLTDEQKKSADQLLGYLAR